MARRPRLRRGCFNDGWRRIHWETSGFPSYDALCTLSAIRARPRGSPTRPLNRCAITLRSQSRRMPPDARRSRLRRYSLPDDQMVVQPTRSITRHSESLKGGAPILLRNPEPSRIPEPSTDGVWANLAVRRQSPIRTAARRVIPSTLPSDGNITK